MENYLHLKKCPNKHLIFTIDTLTVKIDCILPVLED